MSSQQSASAPTSSQPTEPIPPSSAQAQSPQLDPSSVAYDNDADPDIDMTLDPSSFTIKEESPPLGGFDGANDDPTQNGDGAGEEGIESKLPVQKDITLQEFLAKMDDYAPIKFIADIAADAYQYSRMRAGNSTSAASVAPGVIPGGGATGGGGGGGGGPPSSQQEGGKGKVGQHVLGQQRAGYGGGGGGSTGRAVLTMEDLGCAVGEYGVNVKRGEFYR
ncbi:MAG: hypothetical protein L6R40_006488 [Gallowayella cf. fulva]|nr:MAG: hypothetical protein L6R40_006488 [Xanthomendoza cf. fulva]